MILDLLKAPDDYRADPVAAAGSAAGHILLGAGICSALSFGLPWPVLWGLIGYGAWELYQRRKKQARQADSFTDWAMFGAGGSILHVPEREWALMCLGLLIAVLVYRSRHADD